MKNSTPSTRSRTMRSSLLLVLFASTASMAQVIAVKPLNAQQQQEAREREMLASSIAVSKRPATTSQGSLPIQRMWILEAGLPMKENLEKWAKTASPIWHVIWQVPKDWLVPAPTAFPGEFPDAATAAIQTLAENGALIKAHISEGNNTIRVFGPGVAQQ